MLGESGNAFDKDKTRLCPSCRMAISVLATKCRFCGEGVGRPREADQHYTVEGLGGSKPTTHGISDSVMNALEAFRAEECERQESTEEVHKSGLFRRPKSPKGAAETSSDEPFPEMDDTAAAEAADIRMSPVRSSGVRSRPRRRSRGSHVAVWVVTGALLCVGGGFGVVKLKAYLRERNTPVEVPFENRTKAVIDSGGSVLDALQAAVEATANDPSQQNLQIADDVRNRLTTEVNALLNGDPWRENLEKAYQMMDKAASIDGNMQFNEKTRTLQAAVDEEYFAYNKTIIAFPNPKTGTVTLSLVNSSNPSSPQKVQVKKGDKVRDRFVVMEIDERFVRLEDTKRQKGPGMNRSFKVYIDGTVR